MRTLSLPVNPETSELRTHRLHRWVIRLGFWAAGIFWIGLASTLCGCNMMHGPAANMVGQGHFRQGDFASAQGAFQRAMGDDPFNADYAYNMARAMEKQGNAQGAEEMYQKAMTIDPAHQLAYRSLGDMLVTQGRQGEATQMMQAWAETQPYSAPAHVELASIQRQTGDVTGAERSMQQAMRIEPRQVAAMNRTGRQQQRAMQAMRPAQQPSGGMQMAGMSPANSPYMNTGYQSAGMEMQMAAGNYPETAGAPYMANGMTPGMQMSPGMAMSPGMNMPPSPGMHMPQSHGMSMPQSHGAVTYSTASPAMMQGQPGVPNAAPMMNTMPMATYSQMESAGPVASGYGTAAPFPTEMGQYGTPSPVPMGTPTPMTTVTPAFGPAPSAGYAPTVATAPGPISVGAMPSVSPF